MTIVTHSTDGSHRHGPVAGVVLAAGRSSRMGRNKLLVEIGGESLVRRTARRAIEGGLSPVIVVLGFEAERVVTALEGLAVTPVRCPEHAAGMHASLRTGILRVPPACEAAVLLLADMPLVTPAMTTAVVARYRSGAEPLVVSLYGEAQAPPTLYSRELFPALLKLEEGGGRTVVREHRARAAILEWPAAQLADLDRDQDLPGVQALALE